MSRNYFFTLIAGTSFAFLIANHSFVFAASQLFAHSDECGFCHTATARALVDSRGNRLSIFDDWKSTMMANAFNDPFFRAKLESEIQRNQHIAPQIEDKCTRCHTPMARTQALWDGAKIFKLVEAEASDFASDGVSCTVCHQITDKQLSEPASFSGNYTIDDRREIYGPYSEVFVNPMLNNINYLPLYGRQIGESALCATCHTLFTPYLDNEGNVAGEFLEQGPYLEWLNSSHAKQESYRSCQDCHMPRIDESIKITNRPPWFRGTQSPFWKHHFTGGNIFMLSLMQANSKELGLTTSEEQFHYTLERTRERLTKKTAEISMAVSEKGEDHLQVAVTVVNRTGHKFPTGFPSRRAWLHMQVTDNSGKTVFESGKWQEGTDIVQPGRHIEPHHDIISSSEQVQIYEAVMGDVDGSVTYTLLRGARYLKDNRLLPEGYSDSGPFSSLTATAGAVKSDSNFNRMNDQLGSGTDTVMYDIGLGNVVFPLSITARLLYQTITPQFAHDLLKDESGTAVSLFDSLYSSMKDSPIIVDMKSISHR